MIPRSQLIVPGNRPEPFSKAADGPTRSRSTSRTRSRRRSTTRRASPRSRTIRRASPLPVTVRVVAVERPEFEGDLEAVVGPNLTGVALPQVENPDAVRHAAARLDALERGHGVEPGRIRLHPGVESARGLRRLHDILTASERVGSASFQGARGGDLVRDLGATWSLEGARAAVRPFARRLRGARGGHRADRRRRLRRPRRRRGFRGRHRGRAAARLHGPRRDPPATGRDRQPRAHACAGGRRRGARVDHAAAFREAEREGIGAIRHRGRLVDCAMVPGAGRFLARAGAGASARCRSRASASSTPARWSGPFVAQLLGDFGADVIKIEPPNGGDPGRLYGPAKDGVPSSSGSSTAATRSR